MTEALPICVLQTGGDYTEYHVNLLRKQIPDIVCLGIDIPLQYDWKGWWAKMEMFNPDTIRQDILFFDLDTVITGQIDKYKKLEKTTVLSDFFYPENSIGSGLMYIKHEDKENIWKDWIQSPAAHICKNRGDQDYLNKFLFKTADRWQTLFPGKIISYKAHIRRNIYKVDNADIVCFHGKPRPWESGLDWVNRIYNR